MHPKYQPEVSLEKLTEYQLEIKTLKAEIELLKKEQVTDKKIREFTNILEERFKQSQVKFRAIFEQSTMGNKILTSDLTIVEVNDSLIKMLGYSSKQDLLNRRILEFAHPDFTNSWQELQRSLWENKIPTFSIDTCLVKKNKSLLWCRVTSILFEDDGKHLGYTILEDITERKDLEQKAQKLYDTQEMIMHLVAHDLKNPLNVISSLAQLVKEKVEKGEPNEALEYINMLQHTCKKGHGIVQDLILIGEMESEGVIEKKMTALVTLIQNVLDGISSLARQKDIEILFDMPVSKVFAEVNEEKLSRVLENLLSNAIKFSHKGGIINIILKEEKDSILLKVQDNGIGVPLDLQAIIFERFTKAKRKGTDGEDTTGLGLFISRRIVELHGGKIWLEGGLKQGATFSIRLPYKS